MKTQRQIDLEPPRWRGGRLLEKQVRRQWRPATDCAFGTADDRLWQQSEPSSMDWFDDGSWISRVRRT